jgi:hypothetical protein
LVAADSVRKRTAPGGYDYRTIKIDIVRRVWSGGEAGAGTITSTTLLNLPQCIKVTHVSEREIAGSGGRYETGDLKVGPITPSYTVGALTGGYTPAQLDPAAAGVSTGTEIVYVLTGAVVGDYRLYALHTERAVSYYMVLRRLRSTP